jgi:hypothetical protein
MRVEDIKFRCSSLGHLMVKSESDLTQNQLNKITEYQAKDKLTEKQSFELNELINRRDNPVIAKGVITHLVDKWVSAKYGRETEITSKYLTKGNESEEDSLTIYSRFKKRIFTKNTENLSNDFITGTPDVIKEHVVDIKTPYDIFTFNRVRVEPINKMYYWQLQGYMALTGADSATLAYCLTDTPEHLIYREFMNKCNEAGIINFASEAAQKIETEVRKMHTYSDIPINERVIEFEIKRNEADIETIYDKVVSGREWIKNNLF